VLHRQGESRKNERGDDRLRVNRSRLPTQLRPLVDVVDRLWARIEIALTARCELYSSLVPRLEHSECAEQKREEQKEPP